MNIKSMVLNLWVAAPMGGGSYNPFTGLLKSPRKHRYLHYDHNTSKITVMK